MRTRKKSKGTRVALLACFSTLLSGSIAAGGGEPGLLPSNFDGFETGDYRNFLPKYRGDSPEWIRPRFHVTDQAIHGAYSLRWQGDDEPHKWFLVSNAFYLAAPLEMSVYVRVQNANAGFRAGLMLMETRDKFSGIHVEPGQAGLHVDARDCAATQFQPVDTTEDTVYLLRLSLDKKGRMTARVKDGVSRAVLAEFESPTTVVPTAVALYVETPAGSEALIDFDDVAVQSAAYRVPAEQWTRAPLPHCVALPRLGDLPQAEGNWVGGHTLFKTDEGKYNMWYRIRSSESRGAGYAFASSPDGLSWRKHPDNPLFIPDPDQFASHEKITVLKVDDIYHGWYTAVVPGEEWRIYYCHSKDGLSWKDEGVVIGDVYTKDPDVVYVNGTYYLYAISSSKVDLAIYTSSDGKRWKKEKVIDVGIHRHPGVYYDPQTETFWLYLFGMHLGVHRAYSRDGIHFSSFEPVWHEPAVGIDDLREGGIDYGQFIRDPHGHILDHENVLMYYQGRNNYENNHPSWQYHGSERILLAGRFTGLHLDLPTYLAPNAPYQYGRFPVGATPAPGLAVQVTSPGRITVTEWDVDKTIAARGTLEGSRGADWRFEVSEGLAPGTRYRLVVNDKVLDSRPADVTGKNVLRGTLPADGTQHFRIEREP